VSNAIAGDENGVALTTDIVSAYLSNNSVAAADIPGLISSVHQAVRALTAPPPPQVEKRMPPVPIKKSITPDHLISLEDGNPYKSLKRHLGKYGLTPAEYRTKWGLPHDYPMVSPNYAKQRSEMAKSLGLGQFGRKRADPAPAKQTLPKERRSRRKGAAEV
jgi:predicted transcriptional regulator